MIKRRVQTIAASLALGTVVALGGAAAANAATESREGGTFTYGVDYGYMSVWSNYYHKGASHGSTACSANSCTRSDRTPAGRTSYADRSATYGGNTAWYWF